MVRCFIILLFAVLSFKGTFSSLQNQVELQQGFCHNETKKIVVALKCDINTTKVVLGTEPGNYFDQCYRNNNRTVLCHLGFHNKTQDWLEFDFIFDHKKHAGKALQITSTCSNGTILNETIKLLPCLEGFVATATRNNTNICIVCKHTSFRLSQGISIIQGGSENRIETCWWNKTSQQTHCHIQTNGHWDGVDCYVTTYTPGTTYYCEIDGQRAEVTMQEQITTTLITKDSTTSSRYESSAKSGTISPFTRGFYCVISCLAFLLRSVL